MANKVRADQLLVQRGLAESRTRAQALILAGNVFSGDRRVAKAGDLLAEDAELTVKGRDHPWVSRGGVKLDHGLTHFGFDVAGAVALDVGSSTGGFTDVLLSRGAAKVYAVDVGTNQLAWKLRNDPRVVVHEKTNARTLDATIIPEPVDVVVCDASFISLGEGAGRGARSGETGGEAGRAGQAAVRGGAERGRQGRGGARPEIHQRVCDEAAAWVASKGWEVLGVTPSPITGPEGNVEFLLGAVKRQRP